MIAAALLHPDVSPKVVDRFRSSGVEIKIQDNLEILKTYLPLSSSAATELSIAILPNSISYKTPMLVVPTGSGNDFAKALGIRSVDIALRAWQQFCARKKW